MNRSYRYRIIGAALLTALELWLAGPLLPNLPTSSMQADWFWSNKIQPERRFDVVFIGDSRIYRGISPADFAAQFAPDDSLSVFNFGFSSAGLDTAFLRAGARLLDPKAPQPILVLGITTSSLADENLANQHFWQEHRRAPLAQWQRKHLNPHLSYFDPTSPSTVLDHLRGQQQGYYQEHLDNGWIASDRYPRNIWENDDHVRRTYPTVEFSQALRQRLLDQVADWQAQGIQVVAFRPPAAPQLEALEMRPEYYPEAALRAQLRARGALWLDLPDRQRYETYDGNHLEERSARRLSADLGRLLRQALHERTQPPIAAAFQDFEQPIQHPAPRIQSPDVPSGQHLQALVRDEFSYTHELPLPPDSVVLYAEVWVRFRAEPSAEQQPMLVVSVEHPTGAGLWEGRPVRAQQLEATQWSRVELAVPYRVRQVGSTVKAYVWNPKGKGVVELDDLRLAIKPAH